MTPPNERIKALDNKLEVLNQRKSRMHGYLIENLENENIKNEIDAIQLSISETEQELKDEYDSNVSTII